MKKLILFLILLSSLYSSTIETSLSKYAGIVAANEKINIIIDSSIDSNKNIFYFESTKKDNYMMKSFKLLLYKQGYNLVFNSKGNFYYITKISSELPKSHFFKLDSPIFEDIEPTLKMLKIQYSYIKNNHTLVYLCTDKQDKDVKKIIQFNDNPPEQFSLKISIIETNLNELKERGVNFDTYIQKLSGSAQYFVNLLSVPYTATNNVFESSSVGLTAVMRFLNEESISKILSSPFFTVESNKEISFSSVNNIPYKTSQASVNGASSSSVEITKYKDVGLKIKLLPKVIDDVIYIDLNLVVENILDKGSSTPSTSKRSLINSFQLKKGQLLVLSGINQEEIQNHHYGVPVLENIPFLGKIFTYDTKNKINKSLTITIEVL